MVNQSENVAELIISVLSEEKCHDLAQIATKYGLRGNSEDNPCDSKKWYLKKRLANKSSNELIEIAKQIYTDYEDYSIEEYLNKYYEKTRNITLITRRSILDYLCLVGDISGNIGLLAFLERVFPLKRMSSTDGRFRNAYSDIHQHMVNNEDWDLEYLFDYLNLMEISENRFVLFLQALVHPIVVVHDEQRTIVDGINKHLRRDGLELKTTKEESGYPVYEVTKVSQGVIGNVKNLIFAADGKKPEIVLVDALNNDIQIVKNAQYCLVYDQAIPKHGLTLGDLLAWWGDLNDLPHHEKSTFDNLYARLAKSLDPGPEKLFFYLYYKRFTSELKHQLPVLIPQVYLHYDPYTVKDRGGIKELPRQRMDFLILFSKSERVVIEIDGDQHYSDNGKINRQKYAEMVSADRELRLNGYEVYRFGGFDFTRNNKDQIIIGFFEKAIEEVQGY